VRNHEIVEASYARRDRQILTPGEPAYSLGWLAKLTLAAIAVALILR
jgi:hypothetical protein